MELGPGQQIANACWGGPAYFCPDTSSYWEKCWKVQICRMNPFHVAPGFRWTLPSPNQSFWSSVAICHLGSDFLFMIGLVTALFRVDSQVFSLPVLELSFLSSECSSPIIIIIIIINAPNWFSLKLQIAAKFRRAVLNLHGPADAGSGCLLSAPICIALCVIQGCTPLWRSWRKKRMCFPVFC